MKISQAWKVIAVAFLKKAAGDVLTEAEHNMTSDGLCHARWAVPGDLKGDQYRVMGDDISAAVDARKVATNEEDLAYVATGTGPGASVLRGTLALLHAAEARQAEAALYAEAPVRFASIEDLL